jgi:DNA-binding MarR family transcriptional regulator
MRSARTKTRQKPQPPATPELSLVDFVPFKLSVVANRVSYMIGSLIESKFDLQVPDWRVLVTLNEFPSLTPNDIADKTSMDKARVSRAQRRLSDLKLIEAADDPSDGRRKFLTLTDLGRSVCNQLIPAAYERSEWLLSAFTAEERRLFTELLGKLDEKTAGFVPSDTPGE